MKRLICAGLLVFVAGSGGADTFDCGNHRILNLVKAKNQVLISTPSNTLRFTLAAHKTDSKGHYAALCMSADKDRVGTLVIHSTDPNMKTVRVAHTQLDPNSDKFGLAIVDCYRREP